MQSIKLVTVIISEMSEMDLLPKKLKEKEKIQINFSKVSRDAARTPKTSQMVSFATIVNGF